LRRPAINADMSIIELVYVLNNNRPFLVSTGPKEWRLELSANQPKTLNRIRKDDIKWD